MASRCYNNRTRSKIDKNWIYLGIPDGDDEIRADLECQDGPEASYTVTTAEDKN